MPNIILLPSADGTISSDWVIGGSPAEADHYLSLDDDNGDTSFVACDDSLETMIIEFANPSVAEADIDTINTVGFVSSGRSTDRRNASAVTIGYHVPSTSAFNETVSYDAHASSYETINGTARTTSDGSSAAWTYSDLENLEMICTKFGTENVQLSYLALRVNYTEAVTVDNATFFGANF